MAIEIISGFQINQVEPADVRTNVQTIADRNNSVFPYFGMKVFVRNENKEYKLEQDLITWTELPSTAGGGSFNSLTDTPNTIISNGILFGNNVGDALEYRALNSISLSSFNNDIGTAITSGAVVGTDLVLTRADTTTFNVDVTSLFDNINVVGGTFNSGTNEIDFTLSDSSTLSVPVSDLLASATDSTLTGDGSSTSPLSVNFTTLVADYGVTLGTAANEDISFFATAAQGLLANTSIQPGANISSLTNDSGYLTTAPVISVNGSAGIVTLNADDIDDTSTTNKFATSAQLTAIGTNTSTLAGLATVASSGSYTSLSNTPSIPEQGIYETSGTIPSNTVATLTDSLSFTGGFVDINRDDAGTLLSIKRNSDNIERFVVTDNQITQRATSHTIESLGNGNGNLFIRSVGSSGFFPRMSFFAGGFNADTLLITGSNKPEIEAPNSGQLTIKTAIGTSIGPDPFSIQAMLHIKGGGSTSATSSLLVENSLSEEKFYVRDDGAVSSKDGYWIDGVKILHLANDNLNAIGIGANSLLNYTGTTSGATAVGTAALRNLTTGSAATAVGFASLSSVTTQNFNTGLGDLTGDQVTGVGNTFLGSRSGFSGFGQLSNVSNSIALGYSSITDSSNQLNINLIKEVVIGGLSTSIPSPASSSFVSFPFIIRSSNIRNTVIDKSNNSHITIAGGTGTGTGVGADIIFQVAPSGVSGSSQNPLVDVLKIKGNGNINISNIPTSSTGLVVGDVWNNGGVLSIV